jgi:RND family efflux transporter MFP subunit
METKQAEEGQDVIPKDLPKISHTRLVAVGIIVVVAFIILFLAGYIPHRIHEHEIAKRAEEVADQPPVVDVANPKPTGSNFELPIPGNVYAWQETAIYARVNGYLKRWTHDIGSHVEAGELLAEIDAPDTDAQLNQARAALEQARANVVKAQADLSLAQATYVRYHGLLQTGGVTQQDLDQRQSDVNQNQAEKAAADAAVKSAQATVEQLEAQQGFEKIVAPFPGTITERTYDVGALISTSNTAAGQQLFQIAETDKLRIFTKVPQPYVTMLRPHQAVDFEVRNYPGRKFTAYLDRTAGALDQSTRTLLTQLDYDNRNNDLWAGMYGDALFYIQRDKPILTVPTSALIFEAEGMQLAIVNGDKVHFRKITLGRDFGTDVEVLTGLSGEDKVVTNPGEKINDGTTVQVAANNQPQGGQEKSAQSPTQNPPTTAPSDEEGRRRIVESDPPASGGGGGK